MFGKGIAGTVSSYTSSHSIVVPAFVQSLRFIPPWTRLVFSLGTEAFSVESGPFRQTARTQDATHLLLTETRKSFKQGDAERKP